MSHPDLIGEPGLARFPCPFGCGKRLKARPQDAGRWASCSRCQKRFRIPAFALPAPVVADDFDTEPSRVVPRPARVVWPVVAIVLGGGCLCGLMVSGWLFLQVGELRGRLADAEQTTAALAQQKRDHEAAIQALRKLVVERSAAQAAGEGIPPGPARESSGASPGGKSSPPPSPADEQAWAKACAVATADSFSAYLGAFPEGAHAREARQAIDDAHWSEAAAANTLSAYKAYLREYPQGRYVSKARQAAEAWQWNVAAREDTLAAYRAFLAAYPDGQFAAAARARLEEKRSATAGNP